jgi:hypothetical protein
LCEPLETTANGKRLVVEDSAACQKTIQTPVAQQVLKTDGANNLTWTNGANNTVLGKDSTGKVEFATLNSVLQAGPVDLGSQPLTTTGSVSTGAISAASVTATGVVTAASVTLAANPTTNLQATTKQYVDAADALKLNKAGDTMTGALIVNSTIASNSTILANGSASKIGYTGDASGSTIQFGSVKTQSVNLNKPTGSIFLNNGSIPANASIAFILNNSVIQEGDLILVNHISGGTPGAYNMLARLGSNPFEAEIVIRNITAAALAENIVINFFILRAGSVTP